MEMVNEIVPSDEEFHIRENDGQIPECFDRPAVDPVYMYSVVAVYNHVHSDLEIVVRKLTSEWRIHPDHPETHNEELRAENEIEAQNVASVLMNTVAASEIEPGEATW